mmetsp:Transcript_10974/g.19198  ORF Transcript_10974/g.19198 Transcript_10974/m.19198 type:complete len:397 (+) Transcript_10974:1284-2474(+)
MTMVVLGRGLPSCTFETRFTVTDKRFTLPSIATDSLFCLSASGSSGSWFGSRSAPVTSRYHGISKLLITASKLLTASVMSLPLHVSQPSCSRPPADHSLWPTRWSMCTSKTRGSVAVCSNRSMSFWVRTASPFDRMYEPATAHLGGSALCGLILMPAAIIRPCSMKSTSHTALMNWGNMLPHMRPFTSTMWGPSLVVYFISTCAHPILIPSASRHVRDAMSTSSSCFFMGRIEGRFMPVFTKSGSCVGKLSQMLQNRILPSSRSMSTSTSSPSRYCSITSSVPCAKIESSSALSSFLSVSYASLASSIVFTLIAPIAHAPCTGFTTAGNVICFSASSSSSRVFTRNDRGTGRPTLFMATRVRCLLRQISIASGGLHARPSLAPIWAVRNTSSSQKL